MNLERERADDDGVVALAKDASALFQSEKFDECVEVLNQLLQKKEGDPKILHNVAIAEFLRDGCSDPKKLTEVLINVKRKIEDLARASVEQTDTAAQAANNSSLVSKGTNMLTNCVGAVLADKIDTSVVALNIATILFHLHEYSKALSVLEPLFHNIEPIDKTTALRVCLIILDIAFLTQDASKFSDVVNYLEKAFGVSYMPNQTDGGSTLQQQMPNLVMKSLSIPNNSSTPDDLNSEGTTTGGNASEDYLSRTLSDETIEYETLLSTLDNSGHSISRLSNVSSSSDVSRKAADRLLPTINLKLQLPVYKLQLLLLTRNLKAAKREVKQAMNIAREVDSSRALLLKSQLEYARGNYSKAFKLLRASSNQSDVGSSIIINNIGCIYFQQGKPHTSTVFFHRALKKCSFLWKEKPRKLTTFSQDKSLLISYNCGLQYLACGKPVLAARFFLKASLVFYNRPLLWLRLAECCLVAVEKGFLNSSEKSRHNPPVKVHVIGQGKWRQLAVENGLLRNSTVMSEVLGSNAKLKLSLPFARQCLHNALHLLSCSESKNLKSGFSTKFSEEKESSDHETAKNDGKIRESGRSSVISANGDAKEQRNGAHTYNNDYTVAWNTMSEYEGICKRENQKIKQAILTDLAFVELELGNPVKALSTALALLVIPECSKMHAFLGHVYAAEALCLMNRPNDAAEHLSTYISGGNSVQSPYSEEDCKQWQAKKTLDADDSSTMQTEKHDNIFLSPEEARLTLYINLASMYTTEGDFEQASRYVAQALAIAPNSQEAALMSVYLDLKLGKSQEALVKLKQCCVKFLPHNSQSKSVS